MNHNLTLFVAAALYATVLAPNGAGAQEQKPPDSATDPAARTGGPYKPPIIKEAAKAYEPPPTDRNEYEEASLRINAALARDPKQREALYSAARAGNTAAVRELLDANFPKSPKAASDNARLADHRIKIEHIVHLPSTKATPVTTLVLCCPPVLLVRVLKY